MKYVKISLVIQMKGRLVRINNITKVMVGVIYLGKSRAGSEEWQYLSN